MRQGWDCYYDKQNISAVVCLPKDGGDIVLHTLWKEKKSLIQKSIQQCSKIMKN